MSKLAAAVPVMRLGVDHGNNRTKSSTGYKFLSGCTSGKKKVTGLSNRVFFNETYYSVGNSRSFMKKDKTSTEDMLIQTLPCIGEAYQSRKLQGNQIQLEIGVGTPLERYERDYDSYKNYFLRDLEFEWNGIALEVEVKRVEVYPQGYAAYAANYAEYGKYRNLRIADLGGGTFDTFRIQDGDPVVESFKTQDYGINYLLDMISDTLDQEDLIDVSESQIEMAIRNQEGVLESIGYMYPEKIIEIAQDMRDTYMTNLLGKMHDRDISFQGATALIGGGALLLKDYWKDYGVNMVACMDDLANAAAFETLLNN